MLLSVGAVGLLSFLIFLLLSLSLSNVVSEVIHPELYFVSPETKKDELLLRYEPPRDSPFHPSKCNQQYHQSHHQRQLQHSINSGHNGVAANDWIPYYEFPTTPRYFWGLTEEEILEEVQYHLTYKRWSDRVLLGKLYFGLLYGLSGLPDDIWSPPSQQQLNQEETDTCENTPKPATTSTNNRISGDMTISANKELIKLESAAGWDIFERSSNYCEWEGISCKTITSTGSSDREKEQLIVTEIRLSSYALKGTLPNDIYLLTDLEHVDFKGNFLRGTIPPSWGSLTNLKTLCLAVNHLSGTIPSTFDRLTNLQHVWFSKNQLTGTIPQWLFRDAHWPNLALMDFSSNRLTGPIPSFPSKNTPVLMNLFLENNQLTGQLPSGNTIVQAFQNLQVVDFGSNRLSGSIPTHWMELPKLRDFNVAGNSLTGRIPTQLLRLTTLEAFVLSDNRLTGQIPRGDDIIPGVGRIHQDAPVGSQWSDLERLKLIMWNNNQLSGKIPPEMLYGLRESLTRLDIGNNTFSGTIPPEIGALTKLKRLDAMGNQLSGTMPDQMNQMDQNLELNFTNNLLVGTVPKIFCGAGFLSVNLLYRQFGCDAVLCPAGTFHPNGAATLQAGCRPCPLSLVGNSADDRSITMSKVLGRTSCEHAIFVHGDLNGDGVLSPREILMLLFVETIGRNWGAQFQSWGDMRINECDLNGIECASDEVARIDLTDAALCSNGERKAGLANECHGLPAELSLLTALEVLTLNRRQFLRGSIPTELGQLSRLRYLDISNCPSMNGPIPSELGLLTQLKYLNLGGCRLQGTIPTELFRLTNLEKLHLSMNLLTGTLPPAVGRLGKIKELMLSRTRLHGVLPAEIGALSTLENLEMYGNRLSGSIPESLGNCTSLKRIDLFDNDLSGPMPDSLSNLEALQILHVKLNSLTGTISSRLGNLPYLSWFDVSANRLHGTIPESFGTSRSIKDFRLGGNMIYEPIPHSLCVNTNINGGLTRNYGCDGVICRVGTYSDPGHATHSSGCTPCPEGRSNMYLGSSSCQQITEADILSVYFDVIGGHRWNALQRQHWKDPSVDVCDWHGVFCDDEGEIQSLRIPVAGIDDSELFS